jgi:hypothetical protein
MFIANFIRRLINENERMKYKTMLLAFLCLFVSTLSAQSAQITSYSIAWNGIVKWSVNSSSINVLSFSGAHYPRENRLPYFNHRFLCDKDFLYSVEVRNPLFSPLTDQESAFFEGKSVPSTVEVRTSILEQSTSSFLDITIFPFIKTEGRLQKLLSFDLQVTKTAVPQRVVAATRHAYASNSVLSQGKFVKIKVKDTGIYKLTFEDLNSMGINPANIRIFGYGGAVLEQDFSLPKQDDLPEVAIWMEKGSDGIFNAGDYILFYAQGINRWKYDKSTSAFTHQGNSYSQYGYYFITSDAGVGKKIVDKTKVLPGIQKVNTITEFLDYKVYEKDLLNIIGIDAGVGSGREFYGERFSDVTSMSMPFTFPNFVPGSATNVKLDVAASSVVNSNFSLSLNGGQTKSLPVPAKSSTDFYEQARGNTNTYSYSPSGDNLTFNLTYDRPTSTSVGYLNYLEINVRRKLKMSGSVMPFQNMDFLGTNSFNSFQLTDAPTNIQIWDVTDPVNVKRVISDNNAGILSFTETANEDLRYVAIDVTAASAFPKPERVGVISNQNLHALTPSDMVILTHPNFLSQAERLAQAHRDIDGLTVEVVTTEQVYNEFSSGAPDATAYRWLMKMLHDRAIATNNTDDMPRYLLLFGRGSFDNRKILPNSGDNLIMTYQAENSFVTTLSYVTDDYFGLLGDNEGTQVPSDLLDIGIGRFPVSTVDQANDVVNKTIGYMENKDKGSWKNRICFLADDGDAALHMIQADSVAVSLARSHPSYQVDKIYLDAYSQEISANGESYPLAKNHFLNLLRSGMLLVDFTGHASPSAWTNEQILTTADIMGLSSKRLPLFVGATCDFLQFDIKSISGGEQVLLNPAGGGIGILSAARPVYASQNFTLNKLFCDNLFKKNRGQQQRIGDVLKYAKNNVGTELNKLSYVYMGDPAVKLNYPTKYKVVTTKINDKAVHGNDTLRALSVATVNGFIADDNGNKVADFNGNLHVAIYDKSQQITTLNNHGDGSMTYSDRPNILFSGDAIVKDGEYSYSFMLPKDIKYNYGNGRMNYYAGDDVHNYEAQGIFEDFVVGGTAINPINDVSGPDVSMYLNTENFVSGDKVNETPLFIANIKDASGINTVGSGIGHDLLLTIDKDPMKSFILNDNFQALVNSYSAGTVKYKLPQLANGNHTITFRVYDLLNNSTTTSIDFNVVTGLIPTIFSVTNYPNPFKESTRFRIIHDRPETILNTTVDIFDIVGKKIWSFEKPSADDINWDLSTMSGVKIKSGVYLYRVSFKTANSEFYSKTNKMIIVEQ